MADQRGFTIVEVMAAALILVTGLVALLGMLMTADHVISTTRYRQAGTSLAREVLEDARGLAYDQLMSSTLASALQPQIPGAAVSGNNLTITRASGTGATSPYTFTVSFSVCSLDDPSDGYGNHNSAPLSGGSWCPDVAANGTQDANPDDYKRLSVTVTPTGPRSTPVIQQTILIYSRPVNGPAVSCMSTTSSCPGSNPSVTSGTSVTFNVTTTSIASKIQWLVNGNPPPSSQIGGGGADPYTPSSTTSSFTWIFPTAADGSYTITALAYDANGNSGTRSTLQVKLNLHTVIPPPSLNAGWNDLVGGVDVQWTPSVDQDVLYYNVYHQYNGGTPVIVASCSVNATSCVDTSATTQAEAPPALSSRPTCTSSSQTYTTSNVYWVVGVDTDPTTGLPREGSPSPKVDANLCDHPPNAPTGLTGTLSGGKLTLSWSAPSTADPDSWDSIKSWRVYRWPSSRGMQTPGDRYQLVGTSSSSYTDTSPDPGAVQQSYCVTAVDSHLDESPCSAVVSG
jgi:Tfp pilus assembly protein PilV